MIRRIVLLLLLVVLVALCESGRAEPAKEAINAVRHGVVGLRQLQYADGSWGDYGPGTTSLAALALLESGVPPADNAIVRAVKYVRSEIVGCEHTYSVSLAVLFLDRLGEPHDVPLIKLLADRLIAGQKSDGGWTYRVPAGDLQGLDKKYPKSPPSNPTAGRSDTPAADIDSGDNSNTQFAILGLWTGRRHGSDVAAALKKVDDRFRNSFVRTNSGVGWGYTVDSTATNGPRTCCALLGLAASMGSKIERTLKTAPDVPTKEKGANRPDPLKEPLMREGFRYALQEYIIELNAPPDKTDLYFMWSLGRTGMTYGLDQIHGINWYRLGLNRLLPLQMPNGLWKGKYSLDVDTSFALLFLTRANLTKDLTVLLNPKQTAELKTEKDTPETVLNETAADRLVREFLSQKPEHYVKKLEEYRDAKGVEYSEAIARIIPRVDTATQKLARDCLASRLARMTPTTLRERLKDSDAELRRAACIACAIKENKELIGDLIAVLDDTDANIVRAAAVALAKLTGENFGPTANATADDRGKAVAAWKKWWEQKGKK